MSPLRCSAEESVADQGARPAEAGSATLSRLALAGLVALVVLGGEASDGDRADRAYSDVGVPHSIGVVGIVLPYGGLAALAQEAPIGLATRVQHSRGPLSRMEDRETELGGGLGSRNAEDIATFLQGYRAYQGNPAWERRITEVMIPCESGWHWHLGDSFHLSVAQFHPGSWATAAEATGLGDPENLYHVGAAVAAWSNMVDPGGSGGWACW